MFEFPLNIRDHFVRKQIDNLQFKTVQCIHNRRLPGFTGRLVIILICLRQGMILQHVQISVHYKHQLALRMISMGKVRYTATGTIAINAALRALIFKIMAIF